ncbi:hypothetical protein ACROYT_G018315 [Oculina patagonica]
MCTGHHLKLGMRSPSSNAKRSVPDNASCYGCPFSDKVKAKCH